MITAGVARWRLIEHKCRPPSTKIDATALQDDWKPNSRAILQNNIDFMDECLKANKITPEAVAAFARSRPVVEKEHRLGGADPGASLDGCDRPMEADARRRLGYEHAASNTIYVARQNNILFSVLAQYFGADAINDRLMLIETISFTTTPEEMLASVMRVFADRSVGAAFFGNYYLMDFELMGGDARQAIIDEDKKRNINVNLPPQVSFGSHQWPTLITPGKGQKPSPTCLETKRLGSHDVELPENGGTNPRLQRRDRADVRRPPSCCRHGAAGDRSRHRLYARADSCNGLARRQKGRRKLRAVRGGVRLRPGPSLPARHD